MNPLENLLEGTDYDEYFNVHYSPVNKHIRLNSILIENSLSRRIIECIENDDERLRTALTLFLVRLMVNPSEEPRRGLFDELVRMDARLHEDGRFFGHKARIDVSFDAHYVDALPNLGRIENRDGAIVAMDRARTFYSPGFPVSIHPSSSRFSKVVLVDPEHVVWIPRTKHLFEVQTCQYEVVSDYDKEEEIGMALS